MTFLLTTQIHKVIICDTYSIIGGTMSQHFLLSAAARTLSLSSVARLTDKEARATFQAIRWHDNRGEPYCPHCGCLGLYFCRSRGLWKCKGCFKQFSVTSGTIFAHHKLPIRDYLLAIAIFCNGAKGISALQLSRDLDVQYKTAFVLAHKLREAMGADLGGGKVKGKVEVDGAWFGGHVRPKNKASERVNRSLAENRSDKRQCVVVMRERAGRTLPYVFKAENLSIQTVKAHIEKGSTVFADEGHHWTELEAKFPLEVVDHGAQYATETANTNQAESYFSRLRRAEVGTHHHIAGPHLESYADEMAWRENNRRVSNGMQHRMIAGACLNHPVSRIWFRYWQRAEGIPPELKKPRRKPGMQTPAEASTPPPQ